MSEQIDYIVCSNVNIYSLQKFISR